MEERGRRVKFFSLCCPWLAQQINPGGDYRFPRAKTTAPQVADLRSISPQTSPRTRQWPWRCWSVSLNLQPADSREQRQHFDSDRARVRKRREREESARRGYLTFSSLTFFSTFTAGSATAPGPLHLSHSDFPPSTFTLSNLSTTSCFGHEIHSAASLSTHPAV